MNYRGTTGDDILDQATLGLTDWPTIYGDSGNDRITIGAGIANGERGNDTIIGTSPLSTVAFWSPGGVVVDLAKGTAHDGYGTTDALVNIHTVHGTDFDDRYVGSAENETFWGLGGSDTFVGGGGSDTVVFWNTKTSEVQVSYEQSTDTFTVRKHTAGGDNGTDILSGIGTLRFFSDGTASTDLTKYNFGYSGSVEIAAANEKFQLGDYTLFNNDWGTPANLLNTSGAHSVIRAANAGEINKDVTVGFQFPDYSPPDYVWGYPEIRWGLGFGETDSEFTEKAGNIKSLVVDYSTSNDFKPGDFFSPWNNDVMMEIWTTDASGKVTNEITVNVWGWPVGSSPTPYSDAYLKASRSIVLNQGGDHTMITYRTTPEMLSGKVDFALLLQDLISEKIVNPDDYVSGLELGTEMAQGSGMFSIQHFDVFQVLHTTRTIKKTGTPAFDVFDITTNNQYSINGGDGIDTVRINSTKLASNMTLLSNGNFSLRDAQEGLVDLSSVERLKFSDKMIAFDVMPAGSAGQTIEIIGAAFGKASLPDHPEYVGIGLQLFDSGKTMAQVAQLCIDTGLVSAADNTSFVRAVWRNVFDSAIDATNLAYYTGLLKGSGGVMTQAELLEAAAICQPNVEHLDLIGFSKTGIEYT